MLKKRPSWDEYFMELAQVISKRSTCLRRSVGALIVKNKQITKTRVERSLYHIILKHTDVAFREYIDNGYIYYARILAFKKASSFLIKTINSSTSIPIINKVASASSVLSPVGIKMLKQDIYASNLYNQVVYNKYSAIIKNDYIHPIEMV